MIALLEHQRIGRRPQGALTERPREHSWRSVDSKPRPRARVAVLPESRRGSERLDELIRRQAPSRTPNRPVRRPRRGRVVRVIPQARVRVRRKGTVAMTVSAVWAEAREYLRENAKLLGGVTAAALALFACAILFIELPRAERAPEISLSPDAAVEGLLLEGRLPEASSEPGALEPAVVKILRVRQHEVQSGETLSEIAGRYRLRLGTIINFNRITDARSIPAGRKLSIPNADGLLYKVSRGDSLGKIVKRYGVSLNALRDWNDLQTDVIKPGQELFVPGGSLTEEEINAVLGKLFIYPTVGELTSTFGMRLNPIVKQWIFHNGVDLHNRTGTSVIAARSGRVSNVEIGPVYGKVVVLAHSGGYQTMYAHLDTILVRRGQNVGQGEQLGTMGSTGSTTGPHLHFSVFKNSEPVDPLRLLH